MKCINKNGFTLIEIIAVIAIIGVLSGTVIAGVGGSLNKSHEDYCSSQVDMLVVAGRDYFNDNLTKLPLEIGKEECVNLTTLTGSKYIEPMKDYRETLCNGANSKVCAIKVTGSNYYYAGYLDCGKCATENTNAENKTTPVISFTPNSLKTTNKDITVEMKIQDENEIVSYAYTVYKREADGKNIVVKQVDFREYKKEKIKITLNKQGTYYIEGYAYNSVGNRGYKQSGDYILDYTLDCSKQIKISATAKEEIIQPETWTNGALKINIVATGAVESFDVFVNKDGTGYKQIVKNATGKKTLTYDDKQTGKYQVKVRAYNDQGISCETDGITYYQDNIAPSCQTNAVYEDSGAPYNGGWTNKNISLKPICTDHESGCAHKNLGTLINKEYNTELSAGVIYDIAGNSAQCPKVKVQIDKTKPVCRIGLSGNKGNNDYYVTNINANLVGEDKNGQVNSGVTAYSINTNQSAVSYVGGTTANVTYSTDTANYKKYYGYVKDAAGNVGECNSEQFKLDKTPPRCNGWTGTSTIWTTGNASVKANCTDATSGCLSSQSNAILSNKLPSNNTTRTAFANATIKDNAGNETNCSEVVNIYKDNEAPSCGDWVGNNSWTKNNITVKLKCSDVGSGCEQSTYNVKEYSANRDETEYSGHLLQRICDNVGNCSSCSNSGVPVKHDTKKPTCSIAISGTWGTNGWYKKNNVNIVLSPQNDSSGIGCYGLSSNSLSSCNGTSVGQQSDTSSAKWHGYVKDGAGNVGKCSSVQFKVDTVPPITPFIDRDLVQYITNSAGTGGKNIYVNIYGTCDYECYQAHATSSVAMSDSGYQCFDNFSCNNYSKDYTGNRVCAYRKNEPCNTIVRQSRDNLSGVKRVFQKSKVQVGCFTAYRLPDIDYLSIYAEDNAGNVSPNGLHMEILNHHVWRADRPLLDKYKKSGNKWVLKNTDARNCPFGGAAAYKDKTY